MTENILDTIFPKEFSLVEYKKVFENLSSIDTTQILNKRMHEFAATIYIARRVYERFDREYNEIELFEAGNCPYGDLDTPIRASNIAYFFANHKNFLNYKGYDPISPSNIFEFDYSSSKLKKTTRTPLEINNTYLNNQIGEYDNFRKLIENAKIPIVFSHYVLGDPKIQDDKFWKLPGIHIHTLATSDIDQENNHNIQNISHRCTNIFGTPANAKSYSTISTTILAYML